MSDTIDVTFDPAIHATDKDGNPSVNTDGSFRKKRRDAGTRTSTRARSTSSRSTRTKAAAAPPDDRTRYAKAVAGVLAVPTAILSMVDPVDGYSAAHYSPYLAEAVADVAIENPQVAAVVEKLAQVGPLGALMSVAVVIGVQFAHNHGKVPEGMARAMGATPRREIERIMQERGEAIAREEAAAKVAYEEATRYAQEHSRAA